MAIKSRSVGGGRMIAYFDESGSHQDAPVFGLACFVARERHWEDFNKRWRGLLDRQAIPEIHMADLEGRHGLFRNWPSDRYRLVRDTIGAILSGVPLWAFYNAFLMTDYDEVIRRPERKPRRYYWAGTPYVVSLQAILEMMTDRMAPRLEPGETIVCHCDRNIQVDGEACRRFEHLIKSRPGWRRVYASLTFASGSKELPLQAADVLAHEMGRWMQTWVRHRAKGTRVTERDMRPIMTRLKKTRRLKGVLFTRDQIRALGMEALRRHRAESQPKAV